MAWNSSSLKDQRIAFLPPFCPYTYLFSFLPTPPPQAVLSCSQPWLLSPHFFQGLAIAPDSHDGLMLHYGLLILTHDPGSVTARAKPQTPPKSLSSQCDSTGLKRHWWLVVQTWTFLPPRGQQIDSASWQSRSEVHQPDSAWAISGKPIAGASDYHEKRCMSLNSKARPGTH